MMKWQIIVISMLVFVFMSFSVVWANEGSAGQSESQISTSSMASLTPLMKSSSSGSKSSSSSSSKTKTHDGDDVTADNNSTSDDSSGFPWWIIAVILVIILGLAGLLIWYFIIRK
jgi:ABC-type transport system involved in multi-copper enzyme maturation permease subunit